MRKKRILNEEQTALVLARLGQDGNLLICETCLDVGTRISEVNGLMVKYVDIEKGRRPRLGSDRPSFTRRSLQNISRPACLFVVIPYIISFDRFSRGSDQSEPTMAKLEDLKRGAAVKGILRPGKASINQIGQTFRKKATEKLLPKPSPVR